MDCTPSCNALIGMASTSLALCGILSAGKVKAIIKRAAGEVDGDANKCCAQIKAAADENNHVLPVAASLIFAAHMCARSRSVTDPLAPYMLGASVVSAASHFVDHPSAEHARTIVHVAQIGIAGYWALSLMNII